MTYKRVEIDHLIEPYVEEVNRGALVWSAFMSKAGEPNNTIRVEVSSIVETCIENLQYMLVLKITQVPSAGTFITGVGLNLPGTDGKNKLDTPFDWTYKMPDRSVPLQVVTRVIGNVWYASNSWRENKETFGPSFAWWSTFLKMWGWCKDIGVKDPMYVF